MLFHASESWSIDDVANCMEFYINSCFVKASMPACEQGVVFHEFGGFSHGSPKVVGVIAVASNLSAVDRFRAIGFHIRGD